MRRCVICLLIAVAGGALHAQAPDGAASPPVPTSVPRLQQALDPADSGFARWRRIQLPRHDNVAAAWTLRAGDWDFLIATPRAMDAMDTSQVVARTLETCLHPLNVSEQDMEHVAAAHPWAAFDSLMDDRPALVISIMRLTRRMAVVLPQPDGPTSTQISPAGTSKLRSWIAGASDPS